MHRVQTSDTRARESAPGDRDRDDDRDRDRDRDRLVAPDACPARRSAPAQAAGFAVSVALVAIVSLVGGSWTDTGTGSWYDSLDQPAWNPPGWVFGPVWGVLYLMMAVAAWLVWRDTDRPRARTAALVAYAVQLVLNLGWTGVFFGLERPGWAVVEIAALAVAIATTIFLFGRVHRDAAWLLVPYLAWVVFAGSINAGVVAMN